MHRGVALVAASLLSMGATACAADSGLRRPSASEPDAVESVTVPGPLTDELTRVAFDAGSPPPSARSAHPAVAGRAYVLRTACTADARESSGLWPGVDLQVLDQDRGNGVTGLALDAGSTPCDGIVRELPLGAFSANTVLLKAVTVPPGIRVGYAVIIPEQ